jgi:hypothetical protein
LAWLFYLIWKKWEKFTNFLKPQKKKKTLVRALPLDSGWPSGQNCKWIIIFDMCCCPLGYTKIISWYYSNIIVVQFAILNYIVVKDNNIVMYYNLPILFTGSIRLILWSSGRPPPTFKYVSTTIMLTIGVGIEVRPSE